MDCCNLSSNGQSAEKLTEEICATGNCCIGDSGGPQRASLNIKSDLNTKYIRTANEAMEYRITAAEAVAELANGELAMDYYYKPDATCSLQWITSGAPDMPGELKIVVKVKGIPFVPEDDPQRQAFTAGGGRALTPAEITEQITNWQALLDQFWNRRATIVTLKKGECLLNYRATVEVQEVASGQDRTISFLEIGPPPAGTAEPLRSAWAGLDRSHASKINIGDNRDGLIPHEYGHWIGWPDEYIEFSGRVKGPSISVSNGQINAGATPVINRSRSLAPSNRASLGVPYEDIYWRQPVALRSIRNALDFDNPTKRFALTNGGRTRERKILRDDAVFPGLMASGVNGLGGPSRNAGRYYYAVAKAFATAYGGGAELYDVVVA